MLTFSKKNKFFGLFLLLPLFLLGQNLNFHHFTESDGYGDRADFNIQIEQDRSGFLWLPNLTGLYRYDGREFRLFKSIAGDTNGLSTNAVRVVHEDSDGKLWVGTGNGIHIYDPETGLFEHLLHDPDDPESLCANDIRSIGEDKDGNIWVGALLFKACVCEKREKKFKRKYHSTGDLGFLQQRNGTIWISGLLGMFKYLPQQDSFLVFTNVYGEDFKTMYGMVDLLEDSTGKIWYASKRTGHGVFEPEASTFSALPSVITNHFSGGKKIRSIYQDDNGSVWFGSDSEIVKYEPGLNSMEHYQHLPEETTSCQKGVITSVFQDRAGSMWFSAHDGSGLSVAHSVDNPFEALDLPLANTLVFLDETHLLSLTDDEKTVYDISKEIIVPFDKFPPAFENRVTPRIKMGPQNILWWNGAIGRGETFGYNFNTGELYKVEEDYWFTLDSEGTVWFAPPKYFDLNRRELIDYKDKILKVDSSEARRNDPYNHVVVDSRGRAWLNGELGGLVCYDRAKDSVRIFNPDTSDPHAVVSGSGNLLFEGSNGWIYFLTNNGMSVYQEENDHFVQLDLSGGFTQAKQVAVVEDNQKNIWLGLSEKLYKINPENLGIQYFDESDGLPPGLFGQTMVKDPQGRIYFTKDEKTFRFQPELLQPDTTAYPIVLTDFYLNRKEIKPSQKSSLLNKRIQHTQQLELEYTQSDFGFRFVSPDFRKGEKLDYYYQLENYDENWVNIGNDIEVHFTNIPYGNYRFKVKAKTPVGKWTPEFNGLKIKVLPAWWETWWFYLACILLITGLVFIWIYRLRTEVKRATKKIKEDKEVIEKQAEQLKEMDLVKSQFFTNISHEFRTPLTIISGMVDQVRNKPEKWHDRGTRIIKENTLSLLNLINQILDLRKLESKNLKLNMMQGDIIYYLRYIKESYQSYAENVGQQLHFLTAEYELVMDYDPDKILRIVSNLLSNAIKYNKPDGHIYFHIDKVLEGEEYPEYLRIKVQDNGEGIPENKLEDIFGRFYQVNQPGEKKVVGSGIGLALTHELVSLMDGKIDVESKVGVGTTFTVLLPITRNADWVLPKGKDPLAKVENEMAATLAKEPEINTEALPVEDESALPNVLIVEDNPQIVQVLIACLEDDYQLQIASNGQIGIDKALEQIPDLIISDVMMPEKDGFELTDILKSDERTDHIPIIILTAKGDIESKLSGLTKGADAYLAKPFEERELKIRIEKLLELRKKLQARYAQFSVEENEPPKIENPFLQKFYELVEEEISNPDLNMNKLCRSLGMSRSQVFRKLKALTGKSATALVRGYRLQKGKQLLTSNDMTVSEVAYEVGFTSLSYFSTVYFEEFGERPSATRK